MNCKQGDMATVVEGCYAGSVVTCLKFVPPRSQIHTREHEIIPGIVFAATMTNGCPIWETDFVHPGVDSFFCDHMLRPLPPESDVKRFDDDTKLPALGEPVAA
jgi:hypothetical protein